MDLFPLIYVDTIPGSVQVFSSYPGLLHSGDDYYLISSGLVSSWSGMTPNIHIHAHCYSNLVGVVIGVG